MPNAGFPTSGSCHASPRKALPLLHSSYGLMRRAYSLPQPLVYPRAVDLCRLLPAPAGNRPFPTLSLRVLPKMPGPLPRRSAGCTYLLVPLQHRPSPKEHRSAYREIPLKRLHSGVNFRGCSHFFMFRPLGLLATLVAPTTAASCRAVCVFYVRARHASLPPHASDMLAVRTGN